MPPVDGRFIDRNSVQDFTDENGFALFVDATSTYLGIGDPDAGILASSGSYVVTGSASTLVTGGVPPPVEILLPQACM